MSTLTPQDGDRELAIAIIEAVAKWANETIPVSDEIFRKETTALCLPLIASHTRAAVERETAKLRAERDAALKANGELARALDIGPMSESARASLAAAQASLEESRRECERVNKLYGEALQDSIRIEFLDRESSICFNHHTERHPFKVGQLREAVDESMKAWKQAKAALKS